MKISSIYIERAYSFNEMQTLGDKIKKLIKAQGWGIQEFSLHIGYEKTRVLRRQGRVLRQIIALLRAQIRYLQEQVFGAIIPALRAIQVQDFQ